MNTTIHSLIWAGVIIAAAFFSKNAGLDTASSFAVTTGLVGAAWASLSVGKSRRSGCGIS